MHLHKSVVVHQSLCFSMRCSYRKYEIYLKWLPSTFPNLGLYWWKPGEEIQQNLTISKIQHTWIIILRKGSSNISHLIHNFKQKNGPISIVHPNPNIIRILNSVGNIE